MTITLSTIGYEGASLDDFIGTLIAAGVSQVIDIRDVPVSRRPGFSKNILARALEGHGISYLHLKPLGDPKPGREAARAGRYEAFKEIYGEHLALPAAQASLRIATEAANSQPSVLLCYERDPTHCHRTIVATAIGELASVSIRNLGVQKVSRAPNLGRGHETATGGAVALA